MGFLNPQADWMCLMSTIEFFDTTASNSDLVVMFMHPSEIHWADAVFGGGRKRPEPRRYSAWTRWRPCKANWHPNEVFGALERNLRRTEKSMGQEQPAIVGADAGGEEECEIEKP
ncbi:hypothetical protein MRB53_010970 [Persea americana]|uniref:Uncharacterized protein n=1 Tax=Persea americana TaxID=3435 RepID=A0ACC2LU23_PERAE|nr:hypothetical protein MRB53_010970 [Persea americana]